MPLNPKVTQLVRRKIEKDYDTPTADLHAEANRIDPSLKRRSHLSFFASYVLPARKAKNARTRPAKPKKKPRKARNEPMAPANDLELSRMPESAPIALLPVHVPALRISAGASSGPEDLLRRVLTEVAQGAMRAESRAEFVDLLARIDRHARDIAGILSSRD